MTKNDFYKALDEVFSLASGTITGKELLSDSNLVDSLSMLGLLLMLDKKFNLQMSPDEIKAIGTIEELFYATEKAVAQS
ncbi:MAG TPA: phosphopantetheine-binding protein [Coxiellaceae bacterium]|nr:phosphopantetheine-binding protein [Coxiellaceae bacterium]